MLYDDNKWSMDFLDVNYYGLAIDKNNKSFRYNLVAIVYFFKIGRTVTINNQNAQSQKRFFHKYPYFLEKKTKII